MSPSSRRRSGRPSARRSPRGTSVLGVLALVLMVGLLAAGAGLLWLWPRCHGQDCPSVTALRDYIPPQASRVFDRSGEVLAHLAPERRIVVPLERIPTHVAGAFLAVEDRRFFRHDGVDYRRAVGALVRDIQTLSFEQGFSTLTMQLARNVFPTHLSRAKTLRRKLWEIVLAREIEREFSKDEILEMYLNQIYLGNGLYGVEAAAQGYFGKSAAELNAEEAALLAAIPKAPSTYDPRRNPEVARSRRDLVLRMMARAGVITDAEEWRAREEPLGLVPPPEAGSRAPYFVAAVRRELRERFGQDAETSGLRVYTTLDPGLQAGAAEAVRQQLAAVEAGKLGRYRGPDCSTGAVKDGADCLQGFFVAMDSRSGDVVALVGGRDFAQSQFDRVTQARRQPGSAFKPILYATALAQGIPISTHLIGPDAASYEGDYRPADTVSDTMNLDLRSALRLSSNRAAVALGERVGVAKVVQTAHTMGLSDPIPAYPSTLLGAAEVVPLELVSAYTAFSNGGWRALPRFILRVDDARGRTLYETTPRRELVFSAEVAFLTTSLMRDVVNHGTGWRVREALGPAIPAAGKTGTTNDATDTWFVGVTPDLAAAAWVGFDRPRRIMPGAEGGKLAAPVWGRAVAEYYRERPAPADWAPPPGVISVPIDRSTGMLATSSCPLEDVRDEWFIPGTEPAEYCRVHPDPGVGGWFRRRMRDLGDIFGTQREPTE